MPLPKNPFLFFLHVSRPYRVVAISATLAVIVAAAIGQSLPLFYKWIIEAIERQDVVAALQLGLLFPAALFIESLLWRLTGVLGMKWTVSVKKYTNDILVENTLQHGQDYFANRFAGSLLNKVGNVVGGVETFVHDFLWTILGMVVSFVVTLYFLFTVEVLMGWLFVGLLVFLLLFNIWLMEGKQSRSRVQAALGSKLRGRIADVFGNVGVIRQFTGTRPELASVQQISAEWRAAHARSWIYSEWSQFANSLILFVFFSAMIYVLITQWDGDSTSIGTLVFVLALMNSLIGRLVFIGRILNGLAKTIGEVEEGLSDLLLEHDIRDQSSVPLRVTQGGIVWQSVTFEYGETKVFENFSISIPPGQRLGLVGPSGAGKSTFVSLLLRQFDIEAGSITIDGQNIAMVTQDSLRAAIAVVPQEPSLFHRSIRENIAYGKPTATEEEIIAVAKKAHAHDFINALPDGYDTLVGERGVKLSGGQKQRIAIARAMLKDAPILILDEATSALDSESEVEIQKALHALMLGKTVIAIAHRLSTLREMDRIVILEQGKITEDGTHESLLKFGGTYARLWAHQAGGFLEEK